MIRNRLYACAQRLLTTVVAWQIATSHSQQPPTGLPGARPGIDAAEYASLQAAIDALPPAGGVIRLPAGTFEISQPLRITQEDVLLEGAGTATHIKNVNTEGKPAIEIDNPQQTNARATLWQSGCITCVTGTRKSGDGILAHHVDEFLHVTSVITAATASTSIIAMKTHGFAIVC
jgi:hypothetical protein